jgi:hypothetical protein
MELHQYFLEMSIEQVREWPWYTIAIAVGLQDEPDLVWRRLKQTYAIETLWLGNEC